MHLWNFCHLVYPNPRPVNWLIQFVPNYVTVLKVAFIGPLQKIFWRPTGRKKPKVKPKIKGKYICNYCLPKTFGSNIKLYSINENKITVSMTLQSFWREKPLLLSTWANSQTGTLETSLFYLKEWRHFQIVPHMKRELEFLHLKPQSKQQ